MAAHHLEVLVDVGYDAAMLARVVSLVHTRQVHVLHLVYVEHPGGGFARATMHVRTTNARLETVAASLRNIVGVREVSVTPLQGPLDTRRSSAGGR